MAGSYRWLRAVAAALIALSALQAAAKPGWDQARLAQLQRSGGLTGAYQFISACYKTHGLASAYSQPFEACIIQDYILTKMTAAVYQRLTEDARQKLGAPEPQSMLAAMSRRVSLAFAQYKISEADARSLLTRTEREGLPVFAKATFPQGQPEDTVEPPKQE